MRSIEEFRPGHPSADPGWAVICLIDPDGTGADLAYTDGLERVELPELMVWARPTHGGDLGADWLLTSDDRTVLLEEWSKDMVEGALAPGDERVLAFDEGENVCRFRFGDPVPAGRLDATDLDDGTPVVPVTWSLTRRGGPPPGPPTSAAVRRVDRWTTRAETVTAHWRRFRTGPEPGSAPALAEVARRCGPMHRWVAARIDSFLAADGATLRDLAVNARVADRARCDHCLAKELQRIARRCGRTGPAREAENAAELVALSLAGDPAGPGERRHRRSWDTVTADLLAGPGGPAGPDLEHMLFEQVRSALRLVLLAAVVADTAGGPLTASAVGAWEWAVAGRPPGRPWLAPPDARAEVSRLLAGVDPRDLVLADIRPPDEVAPEVMHADLLVRGLQITTAASARGRLLTRAQRTGLTRAQQERAESVAATVLTLTAAPDRFHPVLWAAVTGPLRSCVPGLPEQPPGQEALL
jgi:hypothetical protein